MSLSKDDRDVILQGLSWLKARTFTDDELGQICVDYKKCLDALDEKDKEIDSINIHFRAADQLIGMKNNEIEALKAKNRNLGIQFNEALCAGLSGDREKLRVLDDRYGIRTELDNA